MFDARDASCDDLHPGEVQLVCYKNRKCLFRRMSIHLNKNVQIMYYNIHHTFVDALFLLKISISLCILRSFKYPVKLAVVLAYEPGFKEKS